MWWLIGGIILTLAYGFLYCLCTISSRASRAEEAFEAALEAEKKS